jgi:hypothetical protein
METVQPAMPDWARREREIDLAWLAGNLDQVRPLAEQGHSLVGRGALVIDVTLLSEREEIPLLFCSQPTIERTGDEDIQRLVREYDPSGEFVAVLLKLEGRVSSYRLRLLSRVKESTPEPPDIQTLMEWEAQGGCEATDGCWVEPDGTCPHGCPSWLIVMGMI